MRKANTSVIFRMKAHEKKIKIISVLTNGEENYFLDKLNEEYTKLATNYVNELDSDDIKSVEDLFTEYSNKSNEFLVQSFHTVKQEFKDHLIQEDNIQLNGVGDKVELKVNFEFKRIGYNYKRKYFF